MSDESRTAATGRLLQRIAATLNVPVSTLYDAALTDRSEAPPPASIDEQNDEMMRLFSSLRDARSRAQCLEYARTLLDAEGRLERSTNAKPRSRA